MIQQDKRAPTEVPPEVYNFPLKSQKARVMLTIIRNKRINVTKIKRYCHISSKRLYNLLDTLIYEGLLTKIDIGKENVRGNEAYIFYEFQDGTEYSAKVYKMLQNLSPFF